MKKRANTKALALLMAAPLFSCESSSYTRNTGSRVVEETSPDGSKKTTTEEDIEERGSNISFDPSIPNALD